MDVSRDGHGRAGDPHSVSWRLLAGPWCAARFRLTAALLAACREAEANKDTEEASAVLIQKLFRGQRVRTWITEKRFGRWQLGTRCAGR
jgi:hypothetical protein